MHTHIHTYVQYKILLLRFFFSESLAQQFRVIYWIILKSVEERATAQVPDKGTNRGCAARFAASAPQDLLRILARKVFPSLLPGRSSKLISLGAISSPRIKKVFLLSTSDIM